MPERYNHFFQGVDGKGHKCIFERQTDNKDRISLIIHKCMLCDAETKFTVTKYIDITRVLIK